MLQAMGFKFAETMSGTYALDSAPSDHRRFTFTIEAQADSTLRHLQNGRARIWGMLEADGLAEDAPIEGTLTVAALARRAIEYDFAFTGDDGKPYRFSGQKSLRLSRPTRSMTELTGYIYDESGAPIGTSVTRFDLKSDLFQFLTSVRPA